MSRAILVLIASLAAASCASGPRQTATTRAVSPPIACATATDCDLAWSRMQLWISEHSTWRIQLANDTVIETFGPSRIGYSGGQLAFRASRTRNANGSGTLGLVAACAWDNGNDYGAVCDADPGTMVNEAVTAVGAR